MYGEVESALTKVKLVLGVRPAPVHRALARLVERAPERVKCVLVAPTSQAELDACGGGTVAEPAAGRGLDLDDDAWQGEEVETRRFGLDREQGSMRGCEGLEAIRRGVCDKDQLRSGAWRWVLLG